MTEFEETHNRQIQYAFARSLAAILSSRISRAQADIQGGIAMRKVFQYLREWLFACVITFPLVVYSIADHAVGRIFHMAMLMPCLFYHACLGS